MVIIKTTFGDITLTLDADKAPITVANFLQHARAGSYDGTIFHRVIDNFMIQGGALTPKCARSQPVSPSRTKRTMA